MAFFIFDIFFESFFDYLIHFGIELLSPFDSLFILSEEFPVFKVVLTVGMASDISFSTS